MRGADSRQGARADRFGLAPLRISWEEPRHLLPGRGLPLGMSEIAMLFKYFDKPSGVFSA
jgi:hypothetical protein